MPVALAVTCDRPLSLSPLAAHLARARLRDRHQAHLREKLRLLKETQGVGQSADGEPAGDNAGDGEITEAFKRYQLRAPSQTETRIFLLSY